MCVPADKCSKTARHVSAHTSPHNPEVGGSNPPPATTNPQVRVFSLACVLYPFCIRSVSILHFGARAEHSIKGYINILTVTCISGPLSGYASRKSSLFFCPFLQVSEIRLWASAPSARRASPTAGQNRQGYNACVRDQASPHTARSGPMRAPHQEMTDTGTQTPEPGSSPSPPANLRRGTTGSRSGSSPRES